MRLSSWFVSQDLGLWQHLCSYFWLEYLCLHGLELPCCWQASGLLSACHWSSTSILPQNRSVQPSLQVQIYCPNHFSLTHLRFPFWGYQSCLLYKIFELQVLKWWPTAGATLSRSRDEGFFKLPMLHWMNFAEESIRRKVKDETVLGSMFLQIGWSELAFCSWFCF